MINPKWKSWKEVPPHWRQLGGAYLSSVDQANLIYKELAEKYRSKDGRLAHDAYARARQEFMQKHRKVERGGHLFWVSVEEASRRASGGEEVIVDGAHAERSRS